MTEKSPRIRSKAEELSYPHPPSKWVTMSLPIPDGKLNIY